MPNLKDDKVVGTKKAEDGAACRWCEKPVEEWITVGKYYVDIGLVKRCYCPHCRKGQKTSDEEWGDERLTIFVLIVLFALILYLAEGILPYEVFIK